MGTYTRAISFFGVGAFLAAGVVAAVAGLWSSRRDVTRSSTDARTPESARAGAIAPGTRTYRPRHSPLDASGFGALPFVMKGWKPDASLEEISNVWQCAGYKGVEIVDRRLADVNQPKGNRIADMILKAAL